MWVATQDLPRSAAHPFYARLNQILDQRDFDGFAEALCARLVTWSRPTGCALLWNRFHRLS